MKSIREKSIRLPKVYAPKRILSKKYTRRLCSATSPILLDERRASGTRRILLKKYTPGRILSPHMRILSPGGKYTPMRILSGWAYTFAWWKVYAFAYTFFPPPCGTVGTRSQGCLMFSGCLVFLGIVKSIRGKSIRGKSVRAPKKYMPKKKYTGPVWRALA